MIGEKFWLVMGEINDRAERYDSKEKAVDHAKRKAHGDTTGNPVYVLEVIVIAQRPVPDVLVRSL